MELKGERQFSAPRGRKGDVFLCYDLVNAKNKPLLTDIIACFPRLKSLLKFGKFMIRPVKNVEDN